MKRILQSIGPAIIVAAVVLGPGSILTSSKVGSQFGYPALGVIVCATILMIAMVALAARIGVIYEDSPCDQLAARLGRPVAIIVGLILFGLVAIFQYSNNVALISGIAPLFDSSSASLTQGLIPALILVVFNAFVITCLYRLRHLYGSIEKLMKLLIGLMVLAFLINFVVVFISPRGYAPVSPEEAPDIIPMLGMIGTTFSIGGAFYQAYLVKEKGWKLLDARKGVFDSIMSISILGVVTAVILMTATRVFYGRPEPIVLSNVGDVARQLQPLFGSWAKIVFCLGIFAGALSSFLVNALIG
ncbi:MAG: NRAMP family divalent metal transporter, partial [Verrucomicrobiales bacterium]